VARNNVLLVALVISTLFHLSMVSVFSIVIRFPSKGVQYFPLDIVESSKPSNPVFASRDILRTPTPDSLLPEETTSDENEPDLRMESQDAIPPVELPRLRAPEDQALRTPEESLRIRTQFSELFESRRPEMPDSWALFTRQLREIGPTLSRTFAGEAKEEPTGQKISTPVPGLNVHVDWLAEPKHRKVLLAPPIQALLSIDPETLDQPVVIVFVVNAQGKVIEARAPAIGENADAIESARKALMDYMFEPSEGEHPREQRGALIIEAERSEL
jgi:hypothetical protein